MRPVLALFLALSVGCEKKEPPAPVAQTASPSGGIDATAEPPAPSVSVAPKKVVDDRTIHAFAGTIGKDQKVLLYVEKKGSALSGLYLGAGSGVGVPLKGTVKADDRFELTEEGAKGKPVGMFDGWFRGGLLKGTYRDAKTKKERIFVTEPLKVSSASFAASYAGSLDDKLRIRAKLDRKGNKVEGVYRYAKSKENLSLGGTLDDNGELLLKETTKAGQETGRIEAFVLSPALVVGRWYSPDKTKSMRLLLETSHSYPEIVDLGFVKVAPQEEYKEPAKNCTVSVLYPVVDSGKGKAALNASFHKATGDGKGECEGATAEFPYVTELDYWVQKSKAPYFGVTFGNYSYTGGAHPNSFTTCVVANTESGEQISIAQKMTPEARKQLQALVMKKLKAEHGVENLSEAGFFEDEIKVSAETNVCLADDGTFEVVFNPYEIAPYVMGAPSVSLTKEEAKPLLPASLAVLAE